MEDKKIIKIEKEGREDINNFIATLKDGSSIAVEASSEKEAKKIIEEHIKLRYGKS